MRKIRKFISILLCLAIILIQEFNDISVLANTNTLQDASSSVENTTASEATEETITVNFSTGGGSLSEYSKTVISGKTYGTLATPIRDGYTFEGWYTDVEGGSKITETSIVSQNVTHTIYAHWKAITVKVTFNGKGITTEEASKNVTFGQTYGTLPTPILTNYTFKGWYTLPTGGELITSESIVNVTSSIMLYPQYTGAAVLDVTFNPDGGTLSETSKSVKYGDLYGTLPVPERYGFQFDGWYISGDEENRIYATSMVKNNANHTLYALWTQNLYAIRFSGNGGTVDTEYKDVQIGELYGTLPTPTRKGYTFLGWYTSLTSDAKQVTSADVFKDVNTQWLCAHWKANEHTVLLKGNGASLSKTSIVVAYDGTYGELPIPTLDNYTFDGWFTKSSEGSQVKPTDVVKANSEEILYAHWTGNVQTVFLEANGGSLTTTQKEVYYGRDYGNLPSPSRTGYTFEGWFTSLNGITKITSDDTVRIKASQTLYAHWAIKTPTITFNGNNGYVIANGEKDTTYVVKLAYGDTYGQLPNAIREGYTCQGWYTSATGGSEITSNTIVTATTSDTLYAHWAGNRYTVNYNANGGSVSVSTQNVIHGETYGTLPVPERANYTFDGWYTEPVDGTKISSTSTVKILGTQTLYAQWTGVKSKVNFEAAGGTSATSFKYVYYNNSYATLPVPTRTGYNFVGWFTDSNAGVEVLDTTQVSIISDQTLFAHWSVKRVNIIFDVNGGAGGNSSKVYNYGNAYGTLSTPTRQGYIFAGWFTAKAGGTQITENSSVNATADDTLYAHWTGNSYYIYFDANGGSITTNSLYVTNGKTYGTLKSATRSGYVFGGWYSKASGGTKILSTSTVDNSGSCTYYAHWNSLVYTVTYAANGGSVSPLSTTVTKGTTYSDFPTPTREGYTFTGWYTSAGASASIVPYTTTTKTLYAHWSGNNYSLIFDGNGGTVSTSSMTVAYGSTYGTLPTPTRSNYTFAGWYTTAKGGYKRSATSVVNFTGSLTLYAQWKGISSKLSYDSNGGAAITTTKTITCEAAYGALSTPTRTGYSFDGWYTSVVGGELITAESIVNTQSNQTLYAHWTVYKPTITFNANGGRVLENGLKVTLMKVIRTYGEYYGAMPAASRVGYTFDGWSTSTTGTTRISESSVITVTTSDTIYARWIANTSTVQFDANGGSVSQASAVVTYGAAYGTLPIPVMTGYQFNGWYTAKIGGTKITAASVVDLLETQTLYANWEEASISVSFNGNGGTMAINNKTLSVTSRSVIYEGTYGGSTGLLPSPNRSGYLFDGWYTQETGGSEITLSDQVDITASQKLYAHWIPESLSVFFHESNGDPVGYSIEATYGGTYGTLPTPIRTNYSFIGWYTTASGNTQVTDSTAVTKTSEHTLYAHWSSSSNHIVTFDANGGNVSTASITVTYEGTYGTLPTPTKTNCTFAGWYTEKEGGYKIIQYNVVTNPANITLYAHWVKGSYNIGFVANGYTLPSITVMNNQPYGELPIPARTGYYFAGWYTKEDGGELITATDNVSITATQILYAHWTAKTPTIVFYANGGNLDSTTKTVVYGSTYDELPTPTLAHYTFDGWYTSLAGNTQVKVDTVCSQVDTQILYAHWTPATYTVTYDANGGTVSSASKVVTYDKTYGSLAKPTWSRHEFLGWYTAADGGELVTAESLVTTSQDFTLYAHWAGSQYIVTFNSNGGSITVYNLTVRADASYGELPVPTKAGYYFNGWFTQAEGGTQITATDTVSVSASYTVYAHWTIKTPIVTFDAQGGNVSVTTKTVTYGSAYGGLLTPTREGLIFSGWYTSDDFEEMVTADTIVNNEENHTLYAYWVDSSGVNPEKMLNTYLKQSIYPRLVMMGQSIDSIDDISLQDDYDKDGLTLEQEYELDTNPFSTDSDEDGLSDYAEINTYGTNPINVDTDNDILSDGTEVSSGLNPLSVDTDEDGIVDSEEVITQEVRLESVNNIDINETLVKPSVNITGKGDYSQKIYAEVVENDETISDMSCISGSAIEFVHDEDLTFESGTLTFNLSNIMLESTPIEDLAIAYYDSDSNVLELLNTTYSASGCAISAQVNHFSTYMVVNARAYSTSLTTEYETASKENKEGCCVRLSNGKYIKLDKDPSLGDDTVDTDKDGIPDVYELKSCCKVSIFNYQTGLYQYEDVWSFYSNPKKVDTDGDGISDIDDINPSNFDTRILVKNDQYISFNTGRVWYNIPCSAYDLLDNFYQFIDNHVDNSIPTDEFKIILSNANENIKNNYNFYELSFIGAYNNEGSKLVLNDKTNAFREKIFKKLTGRKCKYYRHEGVLIWQNWKEVGSYSDGGFFKGKVFSEADFNFTYKEFNEQDVYDVVTCTIEIGALIIAAAFTAEVAVPIITANTKALIYYCSTFGIKNGLQMYRYLGVANLPNGVISWLQTDMADGDSSIDEIGGKIYSSGNAAIENANYAQRTYNYKFSVDGIKNYSKLAGEPINTVDDLANAIQSGKINVSDITVDYIVRDESTLILNTRTSQALIKAGIPRSLWYSIDRTGNEFYESLLTNQLTRNRLTSSGISTVRLSGGN